MNNNFVLLKQSFPVSDIERECDGYNYLMKNTTLEERLKLNINDIELQEFISEGERYMYRVGKENGIFKTMHISLKNFEILRKKYFIFKD